MVTKLQFVTWKSHDENDLPIDFAVRTAEMRPLHNGPVRYVSTLLSSRDAVSRCMHRRS